MTPAKFATLKPGDVIRGVDREFTIERQIDKSPTYALRRTKVWAWGACLVARDMVAAAFATIAGKP